MRATKYTQDPSINQCHEVSVSYHIKVLFQLAENQAKLN